MSLELALERIEAQQAKVKNPSYQWQVGEQLKDICRHEPRSAELIAQDLENEAMSIIEAEKKISAFARKHAGCVTAIQSDKIIREFYGLPDPEKAAPPIPTPPSGNRDIIRLEDFF